MSTLSDYIDRLKAKDPTLTTLYLGSNHIGDVGARALAAALPTSKVTKLDLCNNQIGDVGVQALAEALPNSNVKELWLGINKIGDVGAQALAAALPNSNVTTLDLDANEIGEDLLKKIDTILDANKARGPIKRSPPAATNPTTIINEAEIIAAQREAALKHGQGI